MAAMLRDSVVVVRTRPRAILLAMITMRKSTHGFPFVSHIWDAYRAPLGVRAAGAPLKIECKSRNCTEDSVNKAFSEGNTRNIGELFVSEMF